MYCVIYIVFLLTMRDMCCKIEGICFTAVNGGYVVKLGIHLLLAIGVALCNRGYVL